MAASSPPKKKDRFVQADTRNRAGLGWKIEDFGSVVGAQSFQVPGTMQYQGVQGTTFGQQTALPKDKLTSQLPKDTPVAQVLTPDEIKRVNTFVKNPQELGVVSGAVNATASFLGNLFNVDDEKETLVESAWDGLLKSLVWPVDQVNHITAAGISALPGGMRTLSWDEANQVSTGQALVTDMGTRAGMLRRGQGFAPAEVAGFLPFGPIGALGAAGAFNNPDSPVQQAGFDVTTPEGKKAFESGYEKFFSGVTDFGMAFADPLFGVGKAGQVARIKFVDRVVTTEAQRAQLVEELKTGLTAAEGKAAPIAEFGREVVKVDPVTGEKLLSYDAIYNHPVISRATNREQLAKALHNIRDTIVADPLDPNKSKAINGYDLYSLVMRWGYGDQQAAFELARVRADMADALAMSERNRLGLMYALNPDVRDKTITIAERAFNKANNQLKALERQGLKDTQDWDAAVRARDIAESTMDDLVNGKFDVLQQSTPDAEALASRVFGDLVANNDALRAAIGADRANALGGIGGSLTSSTKGFAVNNRVGRGIEARRIRRAQATTATTMTRGRMAATGEMAARGGRAEQMERVANPLNRRFWTSDEYGNGFTRNVVLWRRAWAENPAGWIFTKGLGAQESYREIRAVLNSIRAYSGDARRIKLDDGSTIIVGGMKRKQQLIQMYTDAVNQSVEGGVDAAQALRQLERAIEHDLYSWYGVHADNASKLSQQAFKSRERLMKGLTDEKRGFWVDENGKFNLVKDPWLESHIQNGTFMQNYRELERLLARTEKSGLGAVLSDASAFVGRNTSILFGWFNEIWRPLVLMRLGYTMRNNIEGQMRAAAFTGGLDPFAAAMVNVGYSARSLFGRLAGHQNIDRVVAAERIQAAKAGGKALPRKYEPWLKAQVEGTMRKNHENQAYISTVLPDLARFSPEIRSWGLDWYSKTLTQLSKDSADARRLGAMDEATAIDDVITTMIKQMDEVDRIFTFEKFNPNAVQAFDNVKLTDILLEDGYQKLDQLKDSPTALSLFFRQGKARARAYSGEMQGPDARTIAGAFDPENPITPVILSMMSSDSTTKSMAGGRAEAFSSWFRARAATNYDVIMPGAPTYWDSVAGSLRQIRSSGLGSRIMRGESDDQIVQYLLKDRDGIEVLRFLNGSVSKPRPGGTAGERVQTTKQVEVGGQSIKVGYGVEPSEDVARFFVEQARGRYEQLVPNTDFRRFVESQPRGVEFGGKELEAAFKSAGGDDKLLHAVVGTHIDEFGLKNPMDMWRTATGFTMKWLGTIPEDTFTRSPFYGARYSATVRNLIDIRQGQPGAVTAQDIELIQRQAHARALKDTKDWLYTIDRPTLLGSIGETTIPFISAAQNSITTLGRLIYNDPNTAVMLANIWRAPNAAGMEDEEGNIVIPIPHEWIPDGVEKFLGLDAMRNIKIKKNQLNVIMPESGFGFIPRPGPLVTVPVSELMKRGWLGQQVESPEILRTVLGGKENADAVWNVYKNYMFGEGQGVAPDTASLSMFLPPVAQRITQLIQKDNNQQFGYWYNAIMRSEWAKYSGGVRPDAPTKEEVMNQTVGFTLLRLAANLTAITPPQYESLIDPMVQTVRYYERAYPNDSNRIINEKFGPMLQMLGDWSNTQNNAGMLPTTDSVEQARKYSDIIGKAAPGLEERGDMSVLTMLTMGNANQLYDDSAYGWQFANVIPGTNRSYREWQTPAQSWVQSDVNAGWATYLRGEDVFKARLRASGATSYRGNQALKAERDSWLSAMASNPFFENWYKDYKDFGSSRTRSAIYMMETLVNDQRWMTDNKDNQIWQFAPLYLMHRNKVIEAVQASGKGIDADGNESIRAYWDQVRADLDASSTQWSSFSSRFLNGDDDPEAPGVSFM